MRGVLLTRYLPPTKKHVARVKAFAYEKSVTRKWHYGQTQNTNHIGAAKELAIMLGVYSANNFYGAELPNGDYAFVIVPRDNGVKNNIADPEF